MNKNKEVFVAGQIYRNTKMLRNMPPRRVPEIFALASCFSVIELIREHGLTIAVLRRLRRSLVVERR